MTFCARGAGIQTKLNFRSLSAPIKRAKATLKFRTDEGEYGDGYNKRRHQDSGNLRQNAMDEWHICKNMVVQGLGGKRGRSSE